MAQFRAAADAGRDPRGGTAQPVGGDAAPRRDRVADRHAGIGRARGRHQRARRGRARRWCGDRARDAAARGAAAHLRRGYARCGGRGGCDQAARGGQPRARRGRAVHRRGGDPGGAGLTVGRAAHRRFRPLMAAGDGLDGRLVERRHLHGLALGGRVRRVRLGRLFGLGLADFLVRFLLALGHDDTS
ncbi:hypothetical protein SPHINGO391_350260 [Sphingomonas aurantiaca]|uniref:Uncharacterized protein n=1 Tax=Sphingomonas aurantiaca TaxID=185949 RepID=A0A5E7Y4Y3_9SPHN|nr:hypothetical protein SPHINGO391_350260 [Sphingomonas aurantiaca]